MHFHSLALLATVCLVSITSRAAPLVIKRDNQQQQGGALTGLTSNALKVTGPTGPTTPITSPLNGAVTGALAAKGGVEAIIPANDKEGITLDKQATGAASGLTTYIDTLAGGGGGQKKEN
ncbi:predicted protein [Lichtheimia corymbifera JMRC:FSU:9682]|uniref:Uncharacterized protein n=1 Tax=Lichtheimia corymbifera JMRC:FSU:9682 TaxID=1263082 RepID=A0A068RQV6_9FUNG|nr:predicted protein [Lichtheimia corymbifera JMRC:FSU:9682]